MANIKITQLPTATTIGDNDLIPVVTGIGGTPVTEHITKYDFAATLGSSPVATNPVENTYSDIASMLADQSNQTTNYFNYVVDASSDPNVLSGDAYYEKQTLSTTTLSTDYRLLSDTEVTIIQDSNSYRVFRIETIQDDGTPLTSVGGGKISFEYSGTDVTAILFNQRYTDAIAEFYGKDVNVRFYNRTTRKYQTEAVASTAWTTVNTDYYRAEVTGTNIQIADLTVNDRVEFFIVEAAAGGGDVSQKSGDVITAGMIPVFSADKEISGTTDIQSNAITGGQTVETAKNKIRLSAAAGTVYLEVDEGNAVVKVSGADAIETVAVRTPTGTGTKVFLDDGTLVETSTLGSSIPASDTGTTITFTEDTLYNEATYLTSGNLTLSLTGAVKGTYCAVYCNGYTPTISGEDYFVSSGALDADALNILSFYYDGTKIYLNIGNVDTLTAPTLVLTAGDTEIDVDWTAITNADNYVIERATDSGFTTALTEIYNGALLTYTDTGLTNGTTYYYRGKAQGSGLIESAWSVTVSETPSVVNPYLANLVASYNLNSDATDYTGNNDGTAANMTYSTAKVSNGGVFNGTTANITIADSTDFEFTDGAGTDTAFSISLWVKWDALSGYLMDKSTSCWRFYIIGGDLSFFLYDSGAAAAIKVNYATASLSTGAWYHIVVTYDGSETAAGLTMYVNGSDVGNNTSFGTYNGTGQSAVEPTLGSQFNDVNFLDGMLDEVHFWKNRELTPSEVSDIYTLENAGTSIL
jgi:hypothetical protein